MAPFAWRQPTAGCLCYGCEGLPVSYETGWAWCGRPGEEVLRFEP